MEVKDCKRFDSCSAPLCPLDEVSLGSGIFYPDEEVCQLRAFSKLDWIRNQRKISRKAINKDFYFNFEMLSRNCKISAGIEGLDPDKTDYQDERAVKDWLKKHPVKKEISSERKEFIRNLGNSYRRGSTPIEKDVANKEINEKVGSAIGKLHLTNENHSRVPLKLMCYNI
jgi:hypothetical protein